MFAYVFWHQRAPKQAVEVYEEALALFHKTLSTTGVDGYMGSLVFRVYGATWIAPEAYEDWYLVEGLGALEGLNTSIMNLGIRGQHDVVAKMSVKGTGTILSQVSGSLESLRSTTAAWVSKPRGMSYDEFYSETTLIIKGSPWSLWRRQLALGPTPEFLILCQKTLGVTENYSVHNVERQQIISCLPPI
jgi:hypothetical protein